jgi:GT2 family glycosyltransferase
MTLDIIIINYNTAADLAACLASLRNAPPASLARVVVVDNASTDDSVARARLTWPTAEIIALDHNVGFAAANNVALRASRAPMCLLLNPDTVVPAGAIDALVGRLMATGAVAAGPRLVDAEGRPELSFGSLLSPWS